MSDAIVNRLDLEVLRLATELHLEKSRRQHEGECDKLLWDLHRAQLDYIAVLQQLLDKLRTVREEQQLALALSQSATIAEKLNGNQRNFDTVLELMDKQPVEERDVADPLGNAESHAIIQNLSKLQTDAREFQQKIASLQRTTNFLANSTVLSVTDRVKDTLRSEDGL